jgi:broad specificity phosphatase PhoE
MPGRYLYLLRHGEAVDDGPLSEAGRQQAGLVGRRLAGGPFVAIRHSPLPRAAETAALIGDYLPGVPIEAAELLGDYTPPPPGPELLRDLPPTYAAMLAEVSAPALAEGARLAAAALERYAVPAGDDVREVIVTHNQVVGWFVRHALGAPDWRWMGLNQCNGALTVIRYAPGRPPMLLAFNDMSHLPPALQWTGFPPELRT